MPFEMPSRGSWRARGGWLIRALATELSLTNEQAAGIVGNLGYESAELHAYHENGQADGLGGYGWAQWTGSRRRNFFKFCEFRELDPHSDEANYHFLLHELQYSHNYVLVGLRQTTTVEQAVFHIGRLYERPAGTTRNHVPAYQERLTYARRALAGAAANS